MLRPRRTGIRTITAPEWGAVDMLKHSPLLALTFISLAACASDGPPEEYACKQFQFEDGITAEVREDAVGVLNSRLEFGAPKDILSMEILISNPDEMGLTVDPRPVKLSAFFRPLNAGKMTCEAFPEAGKRCYVDIPNSALQMSANFDSDVSEAKAESVMDVLVVYVTSSVLDCR